MNLKVKLSFLLIASFITSSSFADTKYKNGSCITPTDKNYSWYGEFARVEAFTKIDGFPGKNYILAFPNYRSNSVIFSQDIELNTERVDSKFCTSI